MARSLSVVTGGASGGSGSGGGGISVEEVSAVQGLAPAPTGIRRYLLALDGVATNAVIDGVPAVRFTLAAGSVIGQTVEIALRGTRPAHIAATIDGDAGGLLLDVTRTVATLSWTGAGWELYSGGLSRTTPAAAAALSALGWQGAPQDVVMSTTAREVSSGPASYTRYFGNSYQLAEIDPETPVVWTPIFSTGTTGTPVAALDVARWESLATPGTLVTHVAGQSGATRLYVDPETGTHYAAYGRYSYSSLLGALYQFPGERYSPARTGWVYLGAVVAVENVTTFGDFNTARLMRAFQ